jgi:hypothetical protein
MPKDIAQSMVNAFTPYFHIIQICRNKSNILENVEPITDELSNMELFSLLLVSQKRLLIDSCLQHAAAALGLPSTVLWIGTSPLIFGYNLHNNIIANLGNKIRLPDSYLFDYNFNGSTHECPIFENPIFDINIIADVLRK